MRVFMKNKLNEFLKGVLIILFLSMGACATTQPSSQIRGAVIDMGAYSLESPGGQGWEADINNEKSIVSFTKIDYVFGFLDRFNLIRISRHELEQQKWNMSEDETAYDFINSNEKIMIEDKVRNPWPTWHPAPYQVENNYRLKYEKKGSATIEGKRVYFLNYKTASGAFNGGLSDKGPYRAEEAGLYLYFPDNFKQRHVFYTFRISIAFMRGTIYKIDLTQIDPVIGSFKETEAKK